ncbi:helix-turn-helix transcriptional regulator [Clostridium sp. Marseille-P2415]|uniref:helix-turn-helix transcriptional regulator n=1 Tax=Clostridium sp. Marseille-P2415 TaxID=1805471 RepID=UPI00098880F7|nr:helix-turn-helix transcriptional regulator [Clostridium sp. Marseille-P2415]
MAENRIRELRKNHNLSQEAFSVILNTTQQTVSRLENGAYDISSNLLIEMAGFFNVTTDYILGISEVKRDLNGQIRMSRELDQCYDIVLRYQNLSDINKRTFRIILERLEQAQRESNETQKNSRMKEDGKDVQNSIA